MINTRPREGSIIEYKAGFCYDPITGKNKLLRESVAIAVCGFLNSGGGKIFVGVKDDGSVCGIEEEIAARLTPGDFDTFEQGVHEYFKRHISPYPFSNIRFSFSEIESKTVAVIEIAPVQFFVYLAKRDTNCDSNEIYVRTGNRTIKLSDKARDQFVAERLGAIWMH